MQHHNTDAFTVHNHVADPHTDAQQVPTILQPEDSKPPVDAAAKDNAAPATAPATNAPLAPPPRPNQANGQENGDYFSGSHTAHLTKEPNPFESAFGNPSETPGKTQLPGVTSLTSPASLLPGGTPGWGGSLRSGPLSPAMLTGPTATNDYFSSDHHPFAGSFPTPNESSLRTGLTPGGGGSMFPAPSPNSQAIYNAMQSGGATPSTLDFHRTAMHARAASLNNQPNNQNLTMPNGATSAPQDPNIDPNIQSRGFPPHSQQQQQDPFGQHDANDAANSLYILAQSREGRNGPQQYPVPQQPQQMNYMPNAPHMGGVSQQQHDMSPDMAKRAAKNSVGSNISGSTQNEQGEFSESGNSEQAKPQTRPRAKKAGSIKAAGNGRRKAEETPGKAPANKKQKSIGGSVNMQDDELDSDEEDQQDLNDGNNGNKKMTDEEKRKNFLERNRYVGSSPLFVPLINLVKELLPSSVVNARSNGLPTSSRRLKYSQLRTMPLLRLSLRFARKSLGSKLSFLHTRTARSLRLKESVVWLCRTSLASHSTTQTHTEWACPKACHSKACHPNQTCREDRPTRSITCTPTPHIRRS